MLSLPNTYSSNLGQHIQEDYLVRIYNEDGNYLAVGTSEQTVGGVTYIGAITNAPSIREGIDLVKGTASLSNISISFSNFSFTSNGTVTLGSSTPIEEELFFGTNFYINRDVEVYSQLEGDSNASNLLLLFKGRLRAVQLSENKITLQVTAHRPLQDIMIPQTISESGLYKPIVFGDYASAGTSFPLQSLLGATARTYPVQVEKIQSGNVFCLTASAGNNSNKTLHVHESGLSPEGSGTLVENMAACSAVETAASSADASPIITKQSGSDNLFAVGTDVDLSRIFKSEMMIKSTDYTITNKYTPSASINISSSTNNSLEVDVNKTFEMINLGSVKHTPSSMVFTINFAYNLTLSRNGGSSGGVINSVTLSAKIFHNDDDTDDENIVVFNTSHNSLTASSSAARTINLHTSSDSEFTGNYPQKIEFTLRINYDGIEPGDVGSGASNSLSGTSTIGSTFITTTTQFERDNSSVQTDTELKDNIKELYSSQDGLSLDGSVIKKPLEAHRYLCEEFADTNIFPTSVGTTNNYINILNNFKIANVQGDMHYWLNKTQKLEDILEDLQHFGFFIGRIKADGNYHYISPKYLTTSTTVSSTLPYLASAGTLHSSNLITSTTDNQFKLTLATQGSGYTTGDLLAISHGSDFEFMKITTPGPMTSNATTQTLTVERGIAPITTATAGSQSAGTTIFRVIFPHAVIDEDDFSNLQIMHTPINELVTKFKIQYLRKPEDNSKYAKTSEFTNTTTRTNYNIEDEKVKEIKNDFDKVGTLTTNYFNYYNHLIGEPRVKVAMDLVNPSFYGIEVGDIIRIFTNKKAPFGKNWRNLYFIVTQTTRTLGKLSISAFEIY